MTSVLCSTPAHRNQLKNNPYLSDLGQGHLHAPELALVAQAELADELELGVEALLLERTARLLEGLADWEKGVGGWIVETEGGGGRRVSEKGKRVGSIEKKVAAAATTAAKE